jgi:hypothetical protein
VNALAATDANQIGILAAMTGILPAPVMNVTPDASGFLNLISVLMSDPEEPAVSNVNTASPKQDATAALMRSMVGDSVLYSGLQSNVFVDATAPVAQTPEPKEKRAADQDALLNAAVALPAAPAALLVAPVTLSLAAPSTMPEVAAAPHPSAPQPTTPETPRSPHAAPQTKSAPVELAFGAVLTRIADEAAPAQAAPKSQAPPPSQAQTAQPQSEQAPQQEQASQPPPQASQLEQPPQAAPAEEKNKPALDNRESATAHVTAAASHANPPAADPAPVRAADVAHSILPSMPQSLTAPQAGPQVAPQSGNVVAETARPTVAEAVRYSEAVQPIAIPQPPGAPAQAFAVRIAQPNAPVVDLHVSERNGQVQVSVRTADTGLQTSLRQDLGTLVSSLQRAGYHAETFTPHGTVTQASSLPEAGSHRDSQDSRGGSREWAGGRQQQQRQRGQNSQAWLRELENQT